MILRSLGVEGWRCFAGSVQVGPFSDGLNIIYGPNGIGKSTLMTALARGLFDSHSVGGADIQSLKPWGRALQPKVTIEFEHEGQRYQLQKQFLNSPTSRLQRFEQGRFVPLAESRDADERARQLLAGEAPGRGASDHRHWGLAQILWASQGSLHIRELAGSTRATIEDALGAQIAAAGSDNLERQIADAFSRFFTPKGKLRSGATAPAIVGWESQRDAALLERTELQHRLEDFENASRRIEDLQRQSQSAQQEEQELSERIRELRQKVQSYRDLIGQQKLHQQAVAAAEESYRNQNECIESIRSTNQELQQASDELRKRQQDLPALVKLVEQFQRESQLADELLANVRSRRNEVNEARQQAKAAERYVRTCEALDDLENKLSRILAAREEIAKLRQNRDNIIAPDKKTLAAITRVARARDDARLQLDAALITVRITPAVEIKLQVTRGEQPDTAQLPAGKTKQIQGSPEVAFDIPGVGTFQATGPTGDCDQLRQAWESATEKHRELTAGYGTDDLAELEARRSTAEELEQQIARAELKMETWLGGEKPDTLREQRSRAGNVLRELLETYPDWKQSPPDPVEMVQRAEQLDLNYSREVEQAEAQQTRAQRSLHAALQDRATQETELARLEAQTQTLTRRLKTLRQDGLDDQTRREKLTRIAMQRESEMAKLADVDKQIAALGEDPTKILQVLEGQLDGVRQRSNDAAQKLNSESGRLEQLTSEAPYSALAKVEEEIDVLEQKISRQRAEIEAVRLLHDTLNEQRREVMQSVLEPIQSRAKHILQRIAGTRFDGVHFDDSLLPSGIAPKMSDDAVDLAQISGGEQEQVHFAVRMALADAAFRNDRQLVVLDDVFTYTDTTRLARIATILDEVAERFQIVLLTCHPERYRGLPKATFFDLESISEGTR